MVCARLFTEFPLPPPLSGCHVGNVGPMNRARWVWVAAAALLLATGTGGSLLGASVVAHNDAQRSHQALVSSSMTISATLKLAIQQENSLVISAKAFVVSNPSASNTEFLSWVRSMQIRQRFPEVGGIGYYAIVRPDQLAEFIPWILTDPPEPLPAGQSYQITPPGSRPFYCLSDFAFSDGGLVLPLGYDVCAAYTSSAQITRAFASNTYVPYKIGIKTYLAVEAPVYSGGVEPATAPVRVATVLGFVGLATSPSFDLNQALAGHSGMAVAFHYGSGASKVTFTAGAAPAGASSTSVNLHNGWHVQTFGAVDGSGVLGNSNALAIFLAGLVLSLLLAVLIYVLGTSRSRALVLVDQRTRELASSGAP